MTKDQNLLEPHPDSAIIEYTLQEAQKLRDDANLLHEDAVQFKETAKNLLSDIQDKQQKLIDNIDKVRNINQDLIETAGYALYASYIICFILLLWMSYRAYQDVKYLKNVVKNKEDLFFKRSLFLGIHIFVIVTQLLLFTYGFSERTADLLLRIAPLIMGIIAIIVGYLNFARKSNAELEYVISFDDTNFSEGRVKFSILNLKDRNIILYGLYIEFDNVSLLLPKSYPLTLSAYAHVDIEILNIVGFKIEDNSIQQDFKIIKRRYNFEHFSSSLDPIVSDYDGDQIIEVIRNSAYILKAVTNLGVYIVNRKKIDSINADIVLSIVTENQVVEEMLNKDLYNLFSNPDQENIEALEKDIYDKKRVYFNDGMRFTLENQVSFKKHDGKYKIYSSPYKNMNTTK